MTRERREILAFTALLLYPAWAHLAVIAGGRQLALVGLLVALITHYAVRLGPAALGRPRVLAVLGIALALIVLDALGPAAFALYLPPIVMSLALLWLFGGSLMPGREPLIRALVRRVMRDERPAKLRYAARLTWFWCVVFAALALESILLALLAPIEVWSLFTNVLNYLVVGAIFILEFGFRVVYFREWEDPREICSRMIQTDIRRLVQ